MEVELIKPTIALQKEYFSLYDEWKASGEPFIPWVIGKDPTDFEGMVNELLRRNKESVFLKAGSRILRIG